MSQEPILRFEKVSKFFPGVVANDKVDLTIQRGEIHSLLGENGAGKSTLMNVLYGLYKADEGMIYVDGQPTVILSPNDAIKRGIGMIHQHFMLIPNFTVWENVALGQKGEASPRLSAEKVKAKVRAIAESFRINIDVDKLVEDLAVGTQQKVEILKAMYRGSKILILDEPTSVLTPAESEELFVTLRKLKNEGCTIIFISHKLKEVMSISDRVSVLRDGKLIETRDVADCTPELLTKLMVGRDVSLEIDKTPPAPGDIALEVRDICLKSQARAGNLHHISLKVRAGEILGIAGVDGNGQNELAAVIAGLTRQTSGQILFYGQDVSKSSVRQRSLDGFSYVPSDRRNMGLTLDFKLYENAVLTNYFEPPYAKHGVLSMTAMRKNTCEKIQHFNIKAPNADVAARNLSGGNQQKLVLAREIQRQPKILLVVQPTWGLDIGACSFVYQKLLEERDRGAAILLISTDLEEARGLSDRLLVIYEGEIMGEVDPKTAKVEDIGLMMAGSKINQNN